LINVIDVFKRKHTQWCKLVTEYGRFKVYSFLIFVFPFMLAIDIFTKVVIKLCEVVTGMCEHIRRLVF